MLAGQTNVRFVNRWVVTRGPVQHRRTIGGRHHLSCPNDARAVVRRVPRAGRG